MEEKILSTKKNGMTVLLLSVAIYILAVVGIIVGAVFEENGRSGMALIVAGIVVLSFGWLLWPGLKVLKPQEALVLTLFGKYIGTLREPGFYFVNPFCAAVNPAAKTHLNQSGDVREKIPPRQPQRRLCRRRFP